MGTHGRSASHDNLSAEVARRRAEAAAAGHRSDEGAARGFLSDADAGVRAVALGALGRMEHLRATDVSAAADDSSPIVRRRAAEVVAGSALGAEVLPALLGDADPGVVEAACFAAGEIGELARSLVGPLADIAGSHSDPLCRESAVAALGAIGDDAGLRAILEALGDKPAVRRRAVIALAAFEGPDVEAALQKSLTDRDWQVRQAAEDQLRADTPDS